VARSAISWIHYIGTRCLKHRAITGANICIPILMKKLNAAVARILGTGIASVIYALGGILALCVGHRRRNHTSSFWQEPRDNALDITSPY